MLERLYGVRHVSLTHDDGSKETLLFVPPTAILEANPIRQRVTAIGDGWLQAGEQRYEGWVYVAAGVWCEQFFPGLGVYGKAGASFAFLGERAKDGFGHCLVDVRRSLLSVIPAARTSATARPSGTIRLSMTGKRWSARRRWD